VRDVASATLDAVHIASALLLGEGMGLEVVWVE